MLLIKKIILTASVASKSYAFELCIPCTKLKYGVDSWMHGGSLEELRLISEANNAIYKITYVMTFTWKTKCVSFIASRGKFQEGFFVYLYIFAYKILYCHMTYVTIQKIRWVIG